MAAATTVSSQSTSSAAAAGAMAPQTQSGQPPVSATNTNSSGCYDRKIAHVRDIFANFSSPNSSAVAAAHHFANTTNSTPAANRYRNNEDSYDFAISTTSSANSSTSPNRSRQHKYKTLERHLSMKKTIRKKMMRDLREIGDATDQAPDTFLDKLKSDLPPTPNIDKPSFWKRLTKSWTSSGS